MKKIEIFDPALCCSSGVCGTEVDQALVTFSADVDWLKKQGGDIVRYNLSQQPMAFVDNRIVNAFLERSGEEGLPLILLEGEIALAGRYPSRDELARWCGIQSIPVNAEAASTGCCGPSSCC